MITLAQSNSFELTEDCHLVVAGVWRERAVALLVDPRTDAAEEVKHVPCARRPR